MSGKRLGGAQIGRWTEAIEARGLAPLALPVLDALDALGLLAAQVLFAVDPFLDARPGGAYGQLADLLLSSDLHTEIRQRLGFDPHEHE